MLSVGRAVWTDGRGDRIFSELSGEPLQTGRRISGTITGGTGRMRGVTGDYELTWRGTLVLRPKARSSRVDRRISVDGFAQPKDRR